VAELESFRQGRHSRYQALVGRFARCHVLNNAGV